MLAELFQKFGKRTFMAPASAAGLTVLNDAAGLGLDFKALVVAGILALGWAVVETWRDTTAMKCGLWKPPAEPPKA